MLVRSFEGALCMAFKTGGLTSHKVN